MIFLVLSQAARPPAGGVQRSPLWQSLAGAASGHLGSRSLPDLYEEREAGRTQDLSPHLSPPRPPQSWEMGQNLYLSAFPRQRPWMPGNNTSPGTKPSSGVPGLQPGAISHLPRQQSPRALQSPRRIPRADGDGGGAGGDREFSPHLGQLPGQEVLPVLPCPRGPPLPAQARRTPARSLAHAPS